MMYRTFLAIIKQRDWKANFLTLLLFALPLIGFQLIRSIDSNGKVFFSAANDGVISGSCITFYENKKMEYCSLSLIGEFCYPGTYEFENNTFYVNYTNNTPRLKSTKMVINDSELWFIDENNETEYKFDVDLKVLDFNEIK